MLSLDPFAQGLGYSVARSPKKLVDYALYQIRINKKARTLARVQELIDTYAPRVIVLEDVHAENSLRKKRIRTLITAITELALEQDIVVRHYSRNQVFDSFDVETRFDLAENVASCYPELNYLRPLKRPIWASEDRRMYIFTAVALAATHFYLED